MFVFRIWQDVDLHGPRAWLKFIDLSWEHLAVTSLTKSITLHDSGAIGEAFVQMAAMDANIIILGYPNLERLKVVESKILKLVYNFRHKVIEVELTQDEQFLDPDHTGEHNGHDDSEETLDVDQDDFSDFLDYLILTHCS
ncbi:uncharacterized protein MELLADRAFT_66294 [Melampsora larici-populina 98AG31]|uniref:Uncharacterized protein n=1 Tax=Melampsora larici-populina (strain 98AG31 / pathotype 3-4-7) TaxID=747676 RepID=F4RYM0_MELLP|nr:uncharacterized protein MELLADRAFT_66294 [Melampsora larici-populina 98AG31]EGG02553.1 hypothetical protein MELLADRAFT_66294 [Melampsora larici-populina 98AG31]